MTSEALPALPVTVIGGYLGAGKTTLVNHLLRNAGGLRIAVLVNDFGEIGIDADLIESRDGDVLNLAGGCVCCSFGSDLVGALMELPDRVGRPDRVLIETSGVALPGSVARSATLAQGVVVDGVVVVADAETLQARAADRYVGDTVLQQLRDADLLVLNKVDLVDAARLDATLAWLSATAPRARVLRCVDGAVPVDVLLGIRDALPDTPPARAAGAGALLAGSARDDGESGADVRLALPAGLGRARAAADVFDTESFVIDRPVDVHALASALANPPPGLSVVRAKGLLDDAGAMTTLQVVGARARVAPAPAGVSGPGRLAVIGLRGRCERAAIAALIDAASTAPPAERMSAR